MQYKIITKFHLFVFICRSIVTQASAEQPTLADISFQMIYEAIQSRSDEVAALAIEFIYDSALPE